MPIATAQTSMQTTRQAMALGDLLPGTTTTIGNAGGTTAIAAAYIGRQVDFFRGKYLLLTSGTYSGEWREISDFTSSTGTFTVASAYTGQVASGVTFEVYSLPLHLFKLAANRARLAAYPAVYKEEVDYLLSESVKTAYGVPRGMRHIFRVSEETYGSQKFKDTFNRGDSTTAPGSGWTASVGTWGVSSERLYSASDADADFVTFDQDLKDGHIRAIVRGTLNHATIYRIPSLAFRVREDYLDAIDLTNCLLVQLKNGVCDLRKNDGGTESSLTTATIATANGQDYLVDIVFESNKVFVGMDEALLLQYELVGLNLKYLDFPRAGIRWDKGGSPTTAARVDDYRAHRIVPYSEHHDWEQTNGLRTVEFGNLSRGRTLSGDRWLKLEGGAPLSAFAADTTYGTLVSDTTATLEIETTDDAWLYFIEECRAELFDMATDPALNGNLETIPFYAAKRDAARARAQAWRVEKAMAMPSRSTRYAY